MLAIFLMLSFVFPVQRKSDTILFVVPFNKLSAVFVKALNILGESRYALRPFNTK
jgi:hypothetical protein